MANNNHLKRKGGGGYESKKSRVMMTDGGLSQLLKTLPMDGRRIIRQAVVDWAKKVRDRAKLLAPVADKTIVRGRSKNKKYGITPPGTLRDKISIGVFNRGLSAKAGIFGVRRDMAYYAHFVEFGTKPHFNQLGARRKDENKKLAQSSAKQHPGSKERPFLRPAAQQMGQAGAQIVIEAIKKSLKVNGSMGTLQPIEKVLEQIETSAKVLGACDLNIAPFEGSADQP